MMIKTTKLSFMANECRRKPLGEDFASRVCDDNSVSVKIGNNFGGFDLISSM